jgi:hypothetical protein
MKLSTEVTSIERSENLIESSFGISSKDSAHILMILRDKLYSDKTKAIIREYSTNALDANIEAGKNNTPIEIECPSRLNPAFSIRDFGPGLSEEEIREVYVMYGASTKRNSNAVVGMLGLGSKSAFGYTDSFNIISYKDHKKKTYCAYIDESKCGKIALLEEIPTLEPDGIQVIIPIKSTDIDSFKNKVIDTLKFMEPKPIIDGKQLEILDRQIIFTETINNNIKYELTNYSSYRSDQNIIMGSVAYPYKQILELGEIKVQNVGFNLYINIGDVDIAANRESLEYTEKTINTLKKYFTEIEEKIEKEIIDRIKNAATLKEAKDLYQNYNSFISDNIKIFWKNSHEINNVIISESLTDHNNIIGYICYHPCRRRVQYKMSTNSYININRFINPKIINISAVEFEKYKGKFCKYANEVSSNFIVLSWKQNEKTNDSFQKLYYDEYQLQDYEELTIDEINNTLKEIREKDKLERKKEKDLGQLKVSSSPRTYTHIGDCFTLLSPLKRKNDKQLKSCDWEKLPADTQNLNERKYYIRIDRFIPELSGYQATLEDIDYILKDLKEIHGIEIEYKQIVGIKKGVIINNPKWFSFSDILKKVYDRKHKVSNKITLYKEIRNSIIQKYLRFDKYRNLLKYSNTTIFELINILKEVSEAFEINSSEFKRYILNMQLSGLEIKPSSDILTKEKVDNILNKIYLEYPLTNILMESTYYDHSRETIEYINLVDEINILRKERK